MSNKDRVRSITRTIEYFASITGAEQEDDRTIVIDLLTNLRHWCDTNDVDFDSISDTSTDHHEEEQ